MNFQGMGCRRFCRRVSLFVVVPLGNLGSRSVYRELWEIVGGLQKWSISLYGSSVRGTWRHTRRLWRQAFLSMGALLGNLGEGSYAEGLCVWKKVMWWASLCIGTSLGNLGKGVHLLKISWRSYGASLSMGALWREPGGRAPLLGTLKDRKKRLWRRAFISIGAPLGNLEGGSSAGDFERWLKRALGKVHLSLKRLATEGLKGGLLYWGPWVMKGRLWRWESLFMGAQLGNLEWAHLLGTLRDSWKGPWRWSISPSAGALWMEPGGRVCLLETLEDR